MVFVNLIALVLANVLLVEDYAGIVTDEEKKGLSEITESSRQDFR